MYHPSLLPVKDIPKVKNLFSITNYHYIALNFGNTRYMNHHSYQAVKATS